MYMHNWYHSNVSSILYIHGHNHNVQLYMAHSPCFYLPLQISLCLPFCPLFYLLRTLLAVTGSVHLGLRLLVNWPPLSQPFTQTLPPPNSQNPNCPAPHYDDLRNNPASSVRNIKNWSYMYTTDGWDRSAVITHHPQSNCQMRNR